MKPGMAQKAHAALCELGLALVDANHQWSDRQRRAWERADRALRLLLGEKRNGG